MQNWVRSCQHIGGTPCKSVKVSRVARTGRKFDWFPAQNNSCICLNICNTVQCTLAWMTNLKFKSWTNSSRQGLGCKRLQKRYINLFLFFLFCIIDYKWFEVFSSKKKENYCHIAKFITNLLFGSILFLFVRFLGKHFSIYYWRHLCQIHHSNNRHLIAPQ